MFTVNRNWNELVRDASAKREKRQILTGNIVAACRLIGGETKLIRYNTRQDLIKNGILMPWYYDNEQEEQQTLYPISHARQIIEALPVKKAFKDQAETIQFVKVSDHLLQVLITKRGNYAIYTDMELRALLEHARHQDPDDLPEFIQHEDRMSGVLHMGKLPLFLEKLDPFGLKYFDTARELEDWEIENQIDQDRREHTAKAHDQVFRYRLNRPYGQGSNPVSGFADYKEPSPDYPFGVVLYNRPLTDKEKYNYSLIPLYDSAGEPYRDWKSYIHQNDLDNAFDKVVEQAKQLGPHMAIHTLGRFIMDHPHQDGNAEFVFGDFKAQDLGRTAYLDKIGPISPMDELIEQLNMELQHA